MEENGRPGPVHNMMFVMLLLLVPAWIAVCLAFLVNELVYVCFFSWWKYLFPPRRPAAGAGGTISASIIVLNWNGKDLLAECLPSVLEAVRHDGGHHEVIVVDNGSTDGSPRFVKEHFPRVQLVALEKNFYFTTGNNAGARAAKNDVLVFLNNDMYVDRDFLRPLLKPFSAGQDVFAVGSQIFLRDTTKRREETGKTRADWHRGSIEYRHEMPTEADLGNQWVPAFWFGGGSGAVDRRKFLEIGGFDTLMDPFYVEDTDNSYQGWKRGWKVLFCADSQVVHRHRATNRRYDRSFVERVIARNQILFIWKNVTDLDKLCAHLVRLPLVVWNLSHGPVGKDAWKVFWMLVVKLPQALSKRNKCRRHYRRSDRDVFRLANSTFEFKQQFLPPPVVESGGRLRILFVCPYLPSPLHAGGGRMLQMIRRLSQRHDVSVLSFSDNDEERRFAPDLEKICRKLVVIDRKAYRQAARPLHPLPRTIEVDFSDPRFGATLREMLGDDDYHIVQCEYIQLANQIPPLQREVAVLTQHEVQHAATLQKLKRTRGLWKKIGLSRKWLLWFDAEIRLAGRFDRIVAVTPEDAWALQRFAPCLPIEVVPTCVDVDYFRPDHIPEEPNSVIYVGAFRHSPNVDTALHLALEIMPKVRAVIPGARLCLAGSHPPPELQRLASDFVMVTGWVDDLRPYLGRASVFAAPIRLGAGIRGKIQEAWAMGKAVVASPLACAGLHARHGETALIAEDPEKFADGIVTLLNDEGLRQRLGQSGRRWVEQQFAWERAVKQQSDLYFDCLKQSGRVHDE